MSEPTPDNEKKRLNILWQYDVLDTVPEALFDDLTELAACICEAPISLISLVDEKRQWFKAKYGTTVNETSRDVSFCAHAIKQSDLFIIPDATKDDRFAANPLVTEDPKIRFYAGAPLITPDGYAIGTLCVIDKIPRELRREQQQALRILARHIVSQLELRRRNLEAQGSGAKVGTESSLNLKGEINRLQRELAAARRRPAAKTSKNRPATRGKKKAAPKRRAKAKKR